MEENEEIVNDPQETVSEEVKQEVEQAATKEETVAEATVRTEWHRQMPARTALCRYPTGLRTTYLSSRALL